MTCAISRLCLAALLALHAGACCLKYIGEKVGEGAKKSILQEDTMRNLFVEIQATGVEKTTKVVRDVLLGEETRSQFAKMAETVADAGTEGTRKITEGATEGLKRVNAELEKTFAEETLKERQQIIQDWTKEQLAFAQEELIKTSAAVRKDLDRQYGNLAIDYEKTRREVQDQLDLINIPLQWGTALLALCVLAVVVLPNLLLFFAHRRAQRTLREMRETLEASLPKPMP